LKASDCTIEELIAVAEKVDRLKTPEFCGINNCGRTYRALNLCWAHYIRLYKWRKLNAWTPPVYSYKDLDAYVQPFKGLYEVDVRELYCHVPGCGKDYHARGLCNSHYLMWYKGRKRNG
jgi:hypothetical protein